jgi:tetratricopeptide (TPR) repeat protein
MEFEAGAERRYGTANQEGELVGPVVVLEGPAEEEGEEGPPAESYLPEARSLLTELRPSGFGEVLVTEAWLAPPPAEPAADKEEVIDRQKLWARRQELRQLRLLRETPVVSYDARAETYWSEVEEARRTAQRAIVDPYSDFVSAFSGVDFSLVREHRAEARDYGRTADALVSLGRAYVASGRLKSARGAFRAAAKAEPFHPDVWWNLGFTSLFVRANKEAAAELEKAAEQRPGHLRSELALAVAHYHLRKYGAAAERFRRTVGSEGLRATARSLLACSLRMQGKWDEARAELRLLRANEAPEWGGLADQCLDCVDRGEQIATGEVRKVRSSRAMLKSLAAVGAGVVWVVYGVTADLFRQEIQWAVAPLFLLALVLGQTLKKITGREDVGEFGNYEQGLPCWQTTSWMRPQRSDM